MSTTLIFKNPLESLIEQKRIDEEARLQREAAAAEQRRLEAEAAAAEAQRVKDEQRQAQQAVADEMKRRAKAKEQYLRKEILSFTDGFLNSLMKRVKDWKIGGIKQANDYALALLSHDDVEIPKTDPGIMNDVRNAFAFGLALKHTDMRNVMSTQYFFGQRQDWFPELYEVQLKAADAHKRRH